jgi:deoxycytidine triphosphate deaminase
LDYGVTTSVLSDGTIRRLVDEGRIKIDPWDPGLVQPASVDLRLGTSFRVFHNHKIKAVDLGAPPSGLTELLKIKEDGDFVIHPTEFVLGRTAESVELPDDVVARIEGKALALDTPVPTPDGWTTMGGLEVGSEVFDAWGMPTTVVAATEVMLGRECREVAFSDGTTIVADVDHLWESWTKRSRAKRRAPEILTTTEIERTLMAGAREYNHHVAQCDPVRYPAKELPVEPYVFGAWIGDGTSAQANLTTADPPILREIELAGYGVEHRGRLRYRIGGAPRRRDAVTGRFTANESLHSTLRAMGVLGAKTIPDAYLQGSVAQRQALLEGLMDTDGYVDRWGRCELTTVKRALAEQYRELVASLGFKPVVSVKTATLNGKDCGLKYDVTFTPDEPVFRLPRKLSRQKRSGRFYFDRAIVDVRPVPSVPVRCIQVAHPRGLFLVSRSFIPTHNSSLGRLGLIVHATAGFVDPGFRGSLTLEITNFNSVPIVLRPGLPIAQLSFMALDRPAERPYGHPELGSHYHGQTEATESRYEGGPAERPLRK